MGARVGGCLLAVCIAGNGIAEAKTAACASPDEAATVQVSAIQQELMDAALGCGETALQEFNAFQTAFGPELRKSDALMLKTFKRVLGGARGDAQYNAFKTRAASEAEMRRVRGLAEFCRDADSVFALALAPEKPSLQAFAAVVPLQEESPVNACPVSVAANLSAADIVPVPRPDLPGDTP